jgi:FliI/YscN family ATPase
MPLHWENIEQGISNVEPVRVSGRVTQVGGLVVEGKLPGAKLGMLCQLRGDNDDEPVLAQVVALKGDKASLMPLSNVPGLSVGTAIEPGMTDPSTLAGDSLIGRVLNGWGEPIDGEGPLNCTERVPLYPPPLNPMDRGMVEEPLSVGVRAVDGLLTCGAGQRLVIMAGAGVGKSTLLAMMARNTDADVTVLGLIGERSREVRNFVEKELGPDGRKKSVVVTSTSNTSVALRIRAAFLATSIAEYYRDKGLKVLLLVDSLTRICMAQRELGLAIGEPPTTRGYPPSAFAIIPQLLERAGTGLTKTGGSITALYTALLETEDIADPIAEAIRAVTDGHIVLARKLADQGHFPAIDLLSSTSRVMTDVASDAQKDAAITVRRGLADLEQARELLTFGAYQRGQIPAYDRALELEPEFRAFLTQGQYEHIDFEQSIQMLHDLAQKLQMTEGA